MARPDLDGFVPGARYRHNDTNEFVEYVGAAHMPELDGEDVGVFRFLEGDGCLIATEHGYDQGETFTLASDAMADDITLEG